MAKNLTFQKILAAVLSGMVATASAVLPASMVSAAADDTIIDGSLKVIQIEQEYNGDQLQPFSQDKPLYPYVGDLESNKIATTGWEKSAAANVVDKYVTIQNDDDVPAYVRNVFAFEMGEYTNLTAFKNVICCKFNRDNADPNNWAWSSPIMIQIDGKNYMATSATYNSALEKDQTTAIPSLKQVYMKSTAGNTETINIDGNGDGKFEILVLSQGVQAPAAQNDTSTLTAFTTLNNRFGPVSEENKETVAQWFKAVKDNQQTAGTETGTTTGNETAQTDPAEVNSRIAAFFLIGDNVVPAESAVDSAEALLAAIENGETEIRLADGSYETIKLPSGTDGLTITGSENTVVGFLDLNGAQSVTIDGVTFDAAIAKAAYSGAAVNVISMNDDSASPAANITLQNCAFTGTYAGDSPYFAPIYAHDALRSEGTKNFTIDHCTFDCTNSTMYIYMNHCGSGTMTVTDCAFRQPTNDKALILAKGNRADWIFKNNTVTNCDAHVILNAGANGQKNSFTFTGNTFASVPARVLKNRDNSYTEQNCTVTISNNTYSGTASDEDFQITLPEE